VKPPVAPPRPVELVCHGVTRVDPYFWLNRRDDPQVLAHLQAENDWTDAVMAHTEELQETLFEEIRGRIQEDDASVPYLLNGFWYYTRYEAGREYPIYARRPGSLQAPEQVMLDVNELASGHGFYQVGGWDVSPGGGLLAYAADAVGRRIYTIHVKDLASGELLASIPGVTANLVWAGDDRTLFYARQDPGTLRADRIFRHTLGTDPADDVLVFEERDETFSTRVSRTKSRRYLLIGSHQTLSTEFRVLDARTPGGAFRVVIPRRRDHLYYPDHFGDHLYLRTNDGGENFRLVRIPLPAAGDAGAAPHGDEPVLEEVIPHRPDVLLSGFEIFRDHLVLSERREGLTRLRVRAWDGSDDHDLDFGEPVWTAAVGTNPEFDTRTLRYLYTSLTTPASVYDHDMVDRTRILRKRDTILGAFSPADYASERIHARAPDGAEVPVSLVYRVGTPRDGSAPLVLYGYGAYGSSTDPTFSPARLSLLDRGVVYAIAHVRGGQELGRRWYEDGRLQRKRNTFSDFIAVAERLVADGYTRPERMYAMGGSAGGLLVGAVLNIRPDLFHGAIAAVPFVDVVTTMLDETIPLTTFEYDEWGNPADPEAFRYMLSYSPYDNVEARDYPHLLVTTGFHDSQVQYWEPAKWVSKLRALRTDDRRLLLRTYMEAGHGGVSGRFRALRETAFHYAFLLDLAGIRR
jgi:oligopeptidase B